MSYRDIEHPLVYKGLDVGQGQYFLNQIYVQESDNINASQPVVMVVGGIYTGGDENYPGEGLVESDDEGYNLNYYRIDMKDNAKGEGTDDPFDLIRNHSYIFNILAANNPGSSDPDPRRATDGLEVEVLDYVDVPLNGIGSQYTLTVSQSLFEFDGVTTDIGELLVTTDGTTEWKLLTDGIKPDWLHVTDVNEGEHTNMGDVVTIEVDKWVNVDSVRSGVFVINAGNVYKVINVIQNFTETANSYIITKEGEYELNVTTRGNGNTKAWTSEDGKTTEEIDFGLTSDIDSCTIRYVGIIWETAVGFVTLKDANGNDQTMIDTQDSPLSSSGCISYRAHNISLGQFGNWKGGSVFDPDYGANALIGIYNDEGKLLWSWHIWALGDYAEGEKTETWTVGIPDDEDQEGDNSNSREYIFLDRNLGAYTNMPGSASFGLLYQWGRKDPFIGAYRENREQEYHRVPKQYTKPYYHPITNEAWAWGDLADETTTDSEEGEGYLVKYTLQHPMEILHSGLLSTEHDNEWAKGLWGTTSYDNVSPENGNKTMWDPSPVGYRVPSLNSFTVYDNVNDLWVCDSTGTSIFDPDDDPGPGTGTGPGSNPTKRYSSTLRRGKSTNSTHYEVEHVSHTLRFVPILKGNDFRTGSPSSNSENRDEHFTSNFVSDAPFYGFWLDYTGSTSNEFYQKYTYDTYSEAIADNYCVGYYDPENPNDVDFGYITGYSGSKPDWATWIPLAGIYNGSMDHFARAGLTDGGGPDNDLYLPASSLQVTSVLWANSPTSTHAGYPAGLLLHGTEGAYTPHYITRNDTTIYEYSSGTEGVPAELATEGMGYWSSVEVEDNKSTDCSIWWKGTSEDGGWQYKDGLYDYQITWYDENGMAGSGRHFHSLADPSESTLANPSYAASVRPIKDKDIINHETETVYMYYDITDSIQAANRTQCEGHTFYLYTNSQESDNTPDQIELVVAFQQEWEVTNPGAKWISISPSSGSTNSGNGTTQVITIRINEATNVQPPSEGDSATITIHFDATDTSVNFTVVYLGELTTDELQSSKKLKRIR